MIDTKTVLIPEQVEEGRRLGRHVEHDAKSLNFAFTAKKLKPLVSTHHERKIPVLDQGELGSCTGNAGTGLLGTEPFFSALPAIVSRHLNEDYAVALYSDATKVDNVAGHYPPDDTGSSGLAIGKVLKRRGLIASYRHAFGLSHALQALLDVPLIIGIPWYGSFDHPDSSGQIHLDESSPLRGGHEVEVTGMEISNPDPTNPEGNIVIPNSWGKGWAHGGFCTLSFADFAILLAQQGDVMTFAL